MKFVTTLKINKRHVIGLVSSWALFSLKQLINLMHTDVIKWSRFMNIHSVCRVWCILLTISLNYMKMKGSPVKKFHSQNGFNPRDLHAIVVISAFFSLRFSQVRYLYINICVRYMTSCNKNVIYFYHGVFFFAIISDIYRLNEIGF